MSDNREKNSSCSAGQQNASKEAQDAAQLRDNMAKIKHKIVVMSGKGGVGKSTVAVNLSVALAEKKLKTGLLDIDVHGPSVPKLLGIEDQMAQGSGEKTIIPVKQSDYLSVMSVGFLMPNRDDAVIWRGPLKYGVIKQFLTDVLWGELDYLIVDSPPGTGDEPLSVCQLIENPDGAIIVTTPQDVALVDVRKSVTFCRQLNIPVLGVVENMSGFVCPHCGTMTEIFKTGGGESMAADMGVPYLGSIPLEPRIVESGDEGYPHLSAASAQNTKAQENFIKIVDTIVDGGQK
ncbi:MAG TPA: Mrp/NBP35 family ATP-binding protein [Spirochaetota bacterium]|nr:Mrp/NBP35 family ATP-binding protein [Spirochaetota bacterium]HPJ34927.1 Mrp/NBP35 family ATP-binding protein [Spirochaetota bacterium]